MLIVICLLSAIHMSIMTTDIRQNEIETSINNAARVTLYNTKISKSYEISTEDEMIAEFNKNLLSQINSDSDITVKVLDADVEEGLLDVEVTASYKYPNGKEGSITSRKTVIYENTPLEAIVKNNWSIIYKNTNNAKFPVNAPNKYTSDETVTLPTPTRTGYDFDGWCSEENCSTGKVTKIDKGSSGNKTFYANWIPHKQKLIYNANGGSDAPVSQVKSYEIDLVLSSQIPTRTGYTFKGWNTKQNGTGTTYQPNAIYSYDIAEDNSSTTLYAQWQINQYTATFNANGGSASFTSIKKNYNEALGTLPTATRTGYTFDGWYTSASGGSKITSSTKMPVNGATYYAHWTPITYTIKYEGNKNTGGSMASTTCTYDSNCKLRSNAFTKTGHSFAGWTGSNGLSYSNGATVKNLTSTNGGTITMTAKWSVNSYTVTWKHENGNTIQTGTYKYGTSVTSPDYDKNFDVYTRGLGYYNGSTQYTTFTMPAYNLVLTGKSQEASGTLQTGHDTYGIGSYPNEAPSKRITQYIGVLSKSPYKTTNVGSYTSYKYMNAQYQWSLTANSTYKYTFAHVVNYPSARRLEQAFDWSKSNQCSSLGVSNDRICQYKISYAIICANKSGGCSVFRS